ncbi:MAG: hypothetical protein ACAI44_04845 [Candidatus Sericytochromatia bacterium]
MDQTYKLPTPPRSSVDPQSDGLRTFDSHAGSKPVSVDDQGNYVYSGTVYLIVAVLLIGLVVLGVILKRARVPA